MSDEEKDGEEATPTGTSQTPAPEAETDSEEDKE